MKTPLHLAFALALPFCGSAEDWKLNPLPYNNPGLVVDLGVGLWAWPMPVDYNDDGKMDLLVGCPDKPSNGVWYFENAGEPGEKMPVFKPGVRLGAASQNMQVSYVNGQPRILAPGVEHLDFRNSKFEKPAKIYPKTNIHPRGVRANMWRYVDYEGDGDQDLIVGAGDWSDYGWDHAYDSQGRWRNGPLHGYIYLIQNEGSDAAPKYSDKPEMLTAGGGRIDLYGWPSPNFADFDGDGDLDLLCGEFLDGFTYFENLGSREKPNYAAGQKLQAEDGHPLVMHLQMITPTAFDWDGDGDFDLIVGDEDGRVALVENTGKLKSGRPVFRQPAYFQQEADTLKFGALATPFVHDWDRDGDEDILSGNTAGNIGFFENLGEAENGLPKWAAPRLLEVDGEAFRIMAGSNGSIQGPCEAKWGYTTLSVADWNGDKYPDIVGNSILSRVYLLAGTDQTLAVKPTALGTDLAEPPAKWYWWQDGGGDPLTQWRSTPHASDFNGDGKLDLVALDQDGILVFRSEGKKAERLFIDEDNQPLRLNAKSCGGSGRVQLALVDWDGDGRTDVIINSENAAWYRNCEDRDGKIVLKRVGNLSARNVSGHNTGPAVCDFDKDGKPDLVIGAEDGRMYHIRHADCIQFTDEQMTARSPKEKIAPRFPGFVSEDFIYEKARFPQCHASTLVETTRGLVAAWFGGTREKAPDVGIWTSYHDGVAWSRPVEQANGIQHKNLRHPCWNPVLFQAPGDGPTMLFFKVGPTPQTWWGEVMVSYDRGRTFRERRRLPEGIDGPVRSKPMLMPDGSLLCPSSTEHDDDWRFHFEHLTNFDKPELGTSWKRVEIENQPYQVIQPTLLNHPDGTIQTLFRSKNEKIIESRSTDGGFTWSPITETNLPNNNSGIEALTLKDGRHLLLYNHIGGDQKNGWGKRNVINLAISKDGKIWDAVAFVEKEEKGEFSYPAMIQTQDGLVHMTYTWNRKKIKHVVIDPTKLKAEPLSKFNKK